MANPVDLMGLKLKNPIITAAGPWAGSADGLQRCIDTGAAAVITETIALEPRARISPRLFAHDRKLFNVMLHSELHLEEWEEALQRIDRRDAKLICSIWGGTPSEITYLARKVEHMGADAIEISIAAPVGSRNQLVMKPSEDIHQFIGAAVAAVSIPVMVKLSYESAVSPNFLWELKQAGVQAVSAIDALKGLSGVDLETGRSLMPSYGGYTSSSIKPVSLATTAALQQYTSLPVVSSGGVLDSGTALELLMLGATAVQAASVILWKGYDPVTAMIDEIDQWLSSHGYEGVEEIRGKALGSLRAFEDIVPSDLCARPRRDCRRTECLICLKSCYPQAISLDDSDLITVDRYRCDGCGLCVDRCPDRLLALDWC